jgi:tryptophan-rich hypothetical protein
MPIMVSMPSPRINPKKLINSKWTAVKPAQKEKHFIVTDVEVDDDGLVISCLIEAVISRRAFPIQWPELKNQDQWIQGWK